MIASTSTITMISLLIASTITIIIIISTTTILVIANAKSLITSRSHVRIGARGTRWNIIEQTRWVRIAMMTVHMHFIYFDGHRTGVCGGKYIFAITTTVIVIIMVMVVTHIIINSSRTPSHMRGRDRSTVALVTIQTLRKRAQEWVRLV